MTNSHIQKKAQVEWKKLKNVIKFISLIKKVEVKVVNSEVFSLIFNKTTT